MNQVKFKQWKCNVKLHKYDDKYTSIKLTDVRDGSPIATASIFVQTAQLCPGEVLIKDYSENEGMLNALVKAKIVSDTGRCVQSGFVSIPVCKLLVTE